MRLSGPGEVSYDVEVSAPIETLDAGEFVRVREEHLITCRECVEKEGATLAIPVRQLIAPTSASATIGTVRGPS